MPSCNWFPMSYARTLLRRLLLCWAELLNPGLGSSASKMRVLDCTYASRLLLIIDLDLSATHHKGKQMRRLRCLEPMSIQMVVRVNVLEKWRIKVYYV